MAGGSILPRFYPYHTPHLHPQVEVAIDSDVIGSTALAFCGNKEGMRSYNLHGIPIRKTYPRTRDPRHRK